MKNTSIEPTDYLVFDVTDDDTHPNHRIVSALSEREAIKRYACEVSIKEELFQEEIYGRVSNFSFSSQFWFVTKEEKDALEQDGHIIATEALFKSRVRTFFKKRAWAELEGAPFGSPIRWREFVVLPKFRAVGN